jgi:2-haloacid dehalogenase
LARRRRSPCAGALAATPKRRCVFVRERWASFDCFGTLVDWERGFRGILTANGSSKADAVVKAFHQHEAAVEAETYRPYRKVTRMALERAIAETGDTIASSTVLTDSWASLPVFDDSVEALRQLRADGWSLAILTNCDDDLFALTATELGVSIDRVVTAQNVRSYKPAPAHFFLFRETIGDVPWVHVAGSWFHDIVPAHRAGIPRVWIDRQRSHEDPALASAVLPDLRELASVVRTIVR